MIQPLPPRIASLVDAAARRHGIAPALARAVAWVESNGKPHVVSRAGAMGIMQLMPATAAALGVANPFDPVSNINAGVGMLARLVRRFGDVPTALAAYNWGPGNVRSGKPLPRSVALYIAKVHRRMGAEAPQLVSSPRPRPRAPEPPPERSNGALGILFAVGVAIGFFVLLSQGRRS